MQEEYRCRIAHVIETIKAQWSDTDIRSRKQEITETVIYISGIYTILDAREQLQRNPWLDDTHHKPVVSFRY